MKTQVIKALSGAVLGLASAFAQADERESDIGSLRAEVQNLAHQVIRDTASAQPDPGTVEGRLRALIKLDPSVMYGNNISLLGSDANAVLRGHSAVPERLRSCRRDADDPVANPVDAIGLCLGNMQELANFGLGVVDTAKLEKLRHRYAVLKP